MFAINFDVVFFRNRVRLTNSRTSHTIDRSAAAPFSTDERLIADAPKATQFIRDLLRESDSGPSRLFRLWVTANVRLPTAYRTEADLSDVRRLLTEAGFSRVVFAEA